MKPRDINQKLARLAPKVLLRSKKILATSIGVAIAVVAVWFIRDSLLYESTDDAHVDGHILPLSTRINGQVQELTVIEGQLVHTGDVLAVMDQRDYSIAVYKALANLAYAENVAASLYYNAAITVSNTGGDLDSAQAAVNNAQGELAAATRKLLADETRLEHASADAVPHTNMAQVESAATTVASDQQLLLQAQEKLLQKTTALRTVQTASQQASLAKANAQAADSQLMQRKAELEQAQLNLSYTIIRSPVTGIIGARRVEVGQNVTVGQEVLDVVSLHDVWVTANFKETQLGSLRPGQPVEIKVHAYGRTWKGYVTNLGGGASSAFNVFQQNATRNYVKVMQRVPVRIDFDRPQSQTFNAEGLLKPGLSAELAVRVRWLPRTPNTPRKIARESSTSLRIIGSSHNSLPPSKRSTVARQHCAQDVVESLSTLGVTKRRS
jgi:membrane fusion protein, multidrug efflux system